MSGDVPAPFPVNDGRDDSIQPIHRPTRTPGVRVEYVEPLNGAQLSVYYRSAVRPDAPAANDFTRYIERAVAYEERLAESLVLGWITAKNQCEAINAILAGAPLAYPTKMYMPPYQHGRIPVSAAYGCLSRAWHLFYDKTPINAPPGDPASPRTYLDPVNNEYSWIAGAFAGDGRPAHYDQTCAQIIDLLIGALPESPQVRRLAAAGESLFSDRLGASRDSVCIPLHEFTDTPIAGSIDPGIDATLIDACGDLVGLQLRVGTRHSEMFDSTSEWQAAADLLARRGYAYVIHVFVEIGLRRSSPLEFGAAAVDMRIFLPTVASRKRTEAYMHRLVRALLMREPPPGDPYAGALGGCDDCPYALTCPEFFTRKTL